MRRSSRLDQNALKKALVQLAYENMNLAPVEQPGQFSIRGGVVDIWLERYQYPVRLDFFGSRVEALYLFDPVYHQQIRRLSHIDVFRYKFTTTPAVKWPKEAVTKFERLLLSDIRPGDLVVHINYGVGRFLRIEERNLEGRPHYYLIVEYAKGEKLYVPVRQIDRLSRYIGVKGYRPELSYLGTASWERTKRRVSGDLIETAKYLMEIYAEREKKERSPYHETIWEEQLAAGFSYHLTPSQEEAWSEISADLEGRRPMDRLLVGDVGFGKTELALRAAFKVVQGGFQAVVLVPTTILAEQHYFTFCERLQDFPVKIARLSRFHGEAEEKKVLTGLASGEIDIVIGTQRLLSDDVHLKKLGILILDEEHRFGVLDKEKLKKMKSEVDILSLSATPIPRTLHLALTKLRDISLITDPPPGRQAVQNYIGPYDPKVVEAAIRSEVDRGGQVYYLYNRIVGIAGETERLRRLLPGIRVVYGHGQMGNAALDQIMSKVLTKKADVLVCTTIIGSGLDIPNVNTVIVRGAERFGLADLYQIRGRVGRSDRQAYAYFLYPKGYQPKGAARERLEALAESAELGAGFNLAERDLEIRGAGNLLGVEQHGNVSLVGFELYLQLLNQAVGRLSRADSV